ncbi:MAG: Crp/Fnr family transcriptional regulator [Silvanigrellales bacterium]|nr:Crp/Fnr family transcriptional regulator [Silvanigrellales bacterium]
MKGETEIYGPGQMIFREGDPSGGIYFVKEGKIEIFRERDGLQVSLGFSQPGDILGTVTIFSRDSRSASARALTQVTLLSINVDSLDTGLKDVPVWAQAVLKDAIARLKFVDEKLVEAKLQEKKLVARVGTPFQHASQMAVFLASLVKLGTINEEGVELFPLKGFVPRCELVLLRRAEYLEKIFLCLNQSGLVKVVEDKKYGSSIQKPRAQLLEEFAVFCLQAGKNGLVSFAPPKLYPWMSSVVRLAKKSPEKDSYSRKELAEALSKEMARTVSEALVGELLAHSVARTLGNPDKIGFNAAQVSRRIVFENTCRLLKDCKDAD